MNSDQIQHDLEDLRDYVKLLTPKLQSSHCENELSDLLLTLDNIIANYNNYQNEMLDFKEIVDNIEDGVFVTDGQPVIKYVNPSYCRILQLKAEEIVGRKVQDILDEGIYFNTSVSLPAIQTKSNYSAIGHFIRYGDVKYKAFCSAVPVFDTNGEVKKVVVSLTPTQTLEWRFEEFKRRQNEEPIVRNENVDDITFERLISSNKAIKEIKKTILKVAPTDTTVLITGESGVGKEVVCDQIFDMSKRKDKPYIKVNCTAIPANLLESELFGYEKGSFTGANAKGKIGLFEMANHGTIVLDEIGDLPMDLQSKLLRVLQQKEFYRIGSSTPRVLDVRVIALTNADLKSKMQEGLFRSDLFYRLSVIPIYVPPLRERVEDIRQLTMFYLDRYCKKYDRNLSLPYTVMDLIESYNWPGNVRELQNVIEYLVLCSEGNTIDVNILRKLLKKEGLDSITGNSADGLTEKVDFFERELIQSAINETGSVRKAAKMLQVDASTISRKAKKYNIPLSNHHQD